MEHMNIDEMNANILQLKANLESVPVNKGGALQKNAKKTR